MIVRFKGLRDGKGLVRRREGNPTMSFLARHGATLHGRLIGTPGEVPVAAEVAKDDPAFIQHKDVALRWCEYADKRARPVSGRDQEGHGVAVVELPNVFQTASLDLRT
jgi:hypothetical protein